MGKLLEGEKLFSSLAVGARVVWCRPDRGGYGLVLTTPGQVVGSTATGRVRVKLNGGRTVTVKRTSLREEPGHG